LIREGRYAMDAKRLCAKDLMQRDVKTVSEATPVAAAAKLMRDGGVSSLVVERCDESDAFGILTRKDIVEALTGFEFLETPRTVAEIMTKPAMTVSPNLSIYFCLQMMRMVGVRRLPVVDGEVLVGVLSNTDVFERAVADLR